MVGGASRWERYETWNEAILEVLFPELDEPEPVYLDFEDDVLAELSTKTGFPADDVMRELAAAVSMTLGHGGPAQIFARHMARTTQWRRSGRRGTPPYLALLGTFCVAAEQMQAGDGMSSSNYIGRLARLLGREDDQSRVGTAYRLVAERLWGIHNDWLADLDGLRGLPTAFALTHRYVGLTLSQALVRSADRERLTDFFRHYGFAPGSDVPPGELVPVLDGWINQRPSPVSSGLHNLWGKGTARERIAQSAAVALATWDGSVRQSRRGTAGVAQRRGHLALTLEIGGFPRKRFAVQALMYLPDPHVPRDATVLTAEPLATIELVPDVPGALGLGRGSSLHAEDVLEGLLRIRDERSGIELEHRPRRLVLFREDEMSRRWVESPQVMLGDNVRLLVKEDLVARVEGVLERIARPGWEVVRDGYPGQPDGWALVTGVEVFSHPGDLVKSTGALDDLAPLIPLTTNQLKIAGGFSLPGRTRGKWHSWAPPEVRAVSDAHGGFEVRLWDLHRFVDPDVEDEVQDTLLGSWEDNGAGVVVVDLGELELGDGDYRVELVDASGEALSSSVVRLRSADTPDARQWALLDPVVYGGGIGCLGVVEDGDQVAVRGHTVSGVVTRLRTAAVPGQPGWSVGPRAPRSVGQSEVRLTMPDADSCIYTGRHRELIDTVETDAQGRPLTAWSHGRCQGCGLVRRYPTRVRPAWRSKRAAARVEPPAPAQHDVSVLDGVQDRTQTGWETAFDALLHTGGGSWEQLERIALQVDASALFVDQFARTLEALGHLDVRRDPATLAPVAWEVSPSVLADTGDGYLFAGYWPNHLWQDVGTAIEDLGGELAVVRDDETISSWYAPDDQTMLRKVLDSHEGVTMVEDAWRHLASALPTLSELMASLPRETESVVGDITWYQPREDRWQPVEGCAATGGFRARRFSTLDFVRTAEDLERGTIARSTVQLSKHVAAMQARVPLMAYDTSERELVVPLGADLPGLYGRAAVAASGRPPSASREKRSLTYHEVPPELAAHLYALMTE